LDLYEKRRIKVVTSYGLTEEFEAKDSIDQGEVVSPLVWRIFYNLLLYAVQRAVNTGYKIETKWPTNLVYNISKEISHQQAVLAFANDTTWIARSKTELQTIVNTAHKFYKINNIEINSKKSELLVFNPDKKTKGNKEYFTINIGKNRDAVHAKSDYNPCRHLGV